MLLTTMIRAYSRFDVLTDITETDDLILDKDGLDLISSPDARIDTLCELVEKSSPEKMAAASKKLQGLSRDSLASRLIDARIKKQRVVMWLINREYTRRGVLPIFRQLPNPDESSEELTADLFWYDLEWLNARHQGHK